MTFSKIGLASFFIFLLVGCSKSNNDYNKPYEYLHFFPTDRKPLSVNGELATYLLHRDNYFKPGKCKEEGLDKINEQKIKALLIATNQAEGRDIKGVAIFCYLDTKKESQDCIAKIADEKYSEKEKELAILYARAIGMCRTIEIGEEPKTILLN